METTLTKEQIEQRKNGIGASESAAILGLSPWEGPLDVYLLKTGQIEKPDSPDMKRGRMLEGALRDWFADEHPEFEIRHAATSRHTDLDFVFATPDGILALNGFDCATLELKAPRSTSDHWGPEGSDEIPAYYLPQVMQQMACTGMRESRVGALLRGLFQTYIVKWDQGFWDDMATVLEDFWKNNVLKRQPPDLKGSRYASEWIQSRYPVVSSKELVPADSTASAMARELREVQLKIKELEISEDTLKNQLKLWLGDRYGLYCPAGKLLYYEVNGRKKTDWESLVASLGGTKEDIAKYTTTGKGARTFRPFWKDEEE